MSRDSRRKRHAKKTLSRQRAAAASPGPGLPITSAADPRAGPIATPRFVAADNQPSALARFAGSTASATYAWIAPTVHPPAPCTVRDRRSFPIDVELAKNTE